MKLVIVRLISDAGGRSGQTDEAGVFDFTGLNAGRYHVRVQKAGYVSLAYGQRRPLQPGTPLQLDAGQHRSRLHSMGTGPDSETKIGDWQIELLEEDVRHTGVVMLPGMQYAMLDAC